MAEPRVYVSVLVLVDRGDGTPEERLVDTSAYHGGNLVDALAGAYEALDAAARKVDARAEAESDTELRARGTVGDGDGQPDPGPAGAPPQDQPSGGDAP